MHISYARTPLPKSIFLAGPTPRSEDVPSWRPEALRLLEKHKFNGTVYVPEDSQASWAFNYDNQIEWELEALHASTVSFDAPAVCFDARQQVIDQTFSNAGNFIHACAVTAVIRLRPDHGLEGFGELSDCSFETSICQVGSCYFNCVFDKGAHDNPWWR